MLSLALSLLLQASVPAPVCILPDGSRFQLELARTDQEKRVGLMFRDSLAADRGMLFVFEREDILPFWMKNTLIPLDVVWLSAGGEVVETRSDLQPCKADPCPKYEPQRLARAALLVNAGVVAAHGIKPGALLRFQGVPGYPPNPPAK